MAIKKPTIEQPFNSILPTPRYEKDWSGVKKNDSTKSAPMKVGGMRPEGEPGSGKGKGRSKQKKGNG